MRADSNASPRLKHRAAQLVVAIAGVCAILASTSVGFPGFTDACTNCTFPPSISLSPGRTIVQVGMPVTFTATTNVGNPTFRWCRVSPGGSICESLPDGTGSSYTLASTSLGDDGAGFRVTVQASEGLAASSVALLHVSPMPAVVFEDREFAETEWIVASESIPPENAASFTVARVPTGGNPEAFRRVTYNVPGGSGTVRAFHGRQPALYHPTSQGAIYLIVFSADCRILSNDSAGLSARLMLEQGGRRYTGMNVITWCERVWRAGPEVFFDRALFRLEDGPACGAAEACPDFSMAAAPIRFGFMSETVRPAGAAAATLEHGFDNWRVAVWRR